MAKYNATVEYFRALATQHADILHSATKKKFYRVNMDEFLSGTMRDLPADGAFVVLINYISDFRKNPSNSINTKQIMFYVLQGYKKDDFTDETASRSNCEDIVEDFIVRMNKDSLDGAAFFESAFDVIDKVRVIPTEIKNSTGGYVGWQISIFLDQPFAKCYVPAKWIMP
jgi:hypothetical protein